MDISSKIAGIAKRLPATHAVLSSDFEFLVRSIGEAKSKAEEDDLVRQMTDISKRTIREGRGFSSRAENPRSLKDFLVYLVYINMLGHDTSWALATVIQLCGNKNLQVKKTAYLTASLLIDPKSELTILLTATIQADLRSDNFLTVCTALQAIPTVANAELANVFLPEVIALVRHDKDAVKKRALTTLHSLLLVDPSIAEEVGKVLIDKLGYKEPAVMFAVLPGLYDLIDRDPEPYKGLVHYFTNILKQASEGKLGRNWVVHRAPAPFLQITLLRLLGRLGRGDPKVSEDMQSVVVDVWKRAESLMSQAGNAILFECMKLATSIVPSDALYSMALESSAVFLNSTDNNLKCAGIETLTRMIEDGDAGKVQQYQMAIVTALRSSDVTLKGRTLDLLFRMAGSNNVEVVFTEVLQFVMDDTIDNESRRYASSRLLEVAESFAPSLEWFVNAITEMLKKAGTVAPAAAQSSLVRVLREGDRTLQERMTLTYYELIESNMMVSVPLAMVICWTLGEYGIESGISFDALCTILGDVLESRRTHAPELAVVCVMSLSKINAMGGKPLPLETMVLLESLQRSSGLPLNVQQAAFEVCSIAERDLASKGVRLLASTSLEGPSDLNFLDDIAAAAVADGAAPYLNREEREAMGMTHRASDAPTARASHLRFEAYQREAPSPTPHAEAVMDAVWPDVAVPSATAGRVDDLFDGLQVTEEVQRASGATRARMAETFSSSMESGGIHVNRQRRWGPAIGSPVGFPQPVASLRPSSQTITSLSSESAVTSRIAPTPAVDPQQERLAASLFGGGGGGAVSGVTASAGGGRASPPPSAAAFDLLDMMTNKSPAAVVGVEKQQSQGIQQRSDLDELFSIRVGEAVGGTEQKEDPFGLLDTPPGAPATSTQVESSDPFSSLL